MKFRKIVDEDYSIPLTSLIDVVFLLLIFFMVSTVFIDFTRRMDIKLPESKTSDAFPNIKNYEIEMSLNKKIYLNGEEITVEKLEARLNSSLSKGAEKRMAIIRADRGLNYGDVIKVMGICKDAKIWDIGVAVK